MFPLNCHPQESQTLANSEETVETEVCAYPRSTFISSLISREEYFQVSRAADDESNYEAKCLIECNRARGVVESGFEVSLLRTEPASCTPKHLVLYCSFKGE